MRHCALAVLLACFAAQPVSAATPTTFATGDVDAHVAGSVDVIATQLGLAAEYGRMRVALGELSAADRSRQWNEALQHLRTAGPVSTDGLIRQSLETALRLLNAAEAGVKSPRWPSDRPATAYQAIAAARLEAARKQWPSIRAGEGLVGFIAPVAEVLWWTQGRTGGARVFDGVDDEVTAGVSAIFSNFGLKAPAAVAAAPPPPVYAPPPVPQAAAGSRWSYSANCPEGTSSGQWELALAPDGTLSGRFMQTNETDVGTISGRVLGNRVEFTRRAVYRGMAFEQRWAATLGGGSMQSGSIVRPTEQRPNCAFTANATSGAPLVGTASPPERIVGFEYEVDRYGGDYRMFDLASDDPQACAATCRREGQCRAWTFVRSGGGNPAKCWLKNQVPAPRANRDTISGVVR